MDLVVESSEGRKCQFYSFCKQAALHDTVSVDPYIEIR